MYCPAHIKILMKPIHYLNWRIFYLPLAVVHVAKILKKNDFCCFAILALRNTEVSQNSFHLPRALGLVFCGPWTAQWEVGRQLRLSMEPVDGLNNSVDVTSLMLKASGLVGDEERWLGQGKGASSCGKPVSNTFLSPYCQQGEGENIEYQSIEECKTGASDLV